MTSKKFHLAAALLILISYIFIIAIPGLAGSREQDVNWKLVKTKNQRELAAKPMDIMANFQLTVALANLGEVEAAYDLFQTIGKKITLKDFNQTVEPLLEPLSEDEENLLLLNYAAFSRVINNDHKQSVFYFQKILELDPDNVWIHNYLAAYQTELEEYNRAEKTLDRALRLKENDYSHFLLAMLNYRRGRILKAILELGRSGNLMNKFLFKR